MASKPRPAINVVRSHPVFLETKNRWQQVVTYRESSSFPSSNSLGWPNHQNMHSLTATKEKEWITYKKVYLGVKLSGITTTADQYLRPNANDRRRVEAEAMNKAMAKFMSGKQQLGADFGERQKSIDMIAKRAVQAYNVLIHLKRGNLYKAVKVLKGGKKPLSKKAAELRLEFAYGWKPLVGSIYDIAQKDFPPQPEMYISEAVKRPVYEVSGNMETSGYIRAVYSMLVSMTSPVLASAEKLGLTNPASIAWELVPFSFVVDWFIPISTYIQNITAFSGFIVQDKCLSYKEELYQSNIHKDGYGRTRIVTTRIRSTHIQPGYRAFPKNPLSITHAMNALALIRVLRK